MKVEKCRKEKRKMSTSVEQVVETIREYVELWKADRLKRGMGILRDCDAWVSEHEMRERFVNANARRVAIGMTKEESEEVQNERKAAAAEFGKGLAMAERLGVVERDTAPMPTSIRLPEKKGV